MCSLLLLLEALNPFYASVAYGYQLIMWWQNLGVVTERNFARDNPDWIFLCSLGIFVLVPNYNDAENGFKYSRYIVHSSLEELDVSKDLGNWYAEEVFTESSLCCYEHGWLMMAAMGRLRE
ncbi:hypothetical protein C5167_011449 [Papaver somniferum]|uniref:DUF4220 domain-containing protein n=1 Tax=Papaver somniferum TaxID=3469 RepID=A0A4Y7K336_PAPSO|nr:hypothetical protein C5167_011449 [Papaver somniferum]